MSNDYPTHGARIAGADEALDNFLDRYVEAYQKAGRKPQTEYIDGWDVSVYRGDVRYGMIDWLPLRRQTALDFSGVEHGLNREIEQSIKAFFQRYYAADIHISYEEEPYTLSQVLSAEDEERLLRNIIAHVLMKDRLKQPATVFIGTSDKEDDLIVSVDNQTGAVGLEYAGQPQHRILTESLTDFLQCSEARVVSE